MQKVFLYPGQGSQTVGMGKDLAESFALARQRYDEASEILGFDLKQVCFHGPEDELRQTRVTQPALFVHSCILTELLAERGLFPSAAAGHSLGEYSALFAAHAFSFTEGLKLVRIRAEAMQQAGIANPGTMAAIVGLDDDVVAQICEELRAIGTVVPANFNAPGQLVISGEVNAVRKAMEVAKSKGAKLVKELVVSGAFHSPLMRPAAEGLGQALEEAAIANVEFPVISNVTAKPHLDAVATRKLLAEQLLSPVRWTASMNELAALGEVEWYEVGSGNVLSGLLKRGVKGAIANTVGSVPELTALSKE